MASGSKRKRGESSSLKRTIWKPQHLISNVPGVSENKEVDSKKGSFHEGKASQKKLLSEMFSNSSVVWQPLLNNAEQLRP